MKKIIVSLLSLVLLLSLLVGCAQTPASPSTQPPENEQTPEEKVPPTYEIFEVGNYDYTSEVTHKLEFSLPEGESFVDAAKRNTKKNFKTLEGDTVEGTYQYSEQYYWQNGSVDKYFVKTEEETISIRWNPALNRMDFYSKAAFDDKYDSSLPQKSKEECIAIAKDFLKNLTEDVDAYTVVGAEYFESNSSTMQPSYYITFERMLGTIRTGDEITFLVGTDGELTHYGYWGFGTLEGVEAPTEDVLKLVEGKMEEKLSSIYEACSEKYTVEYEWQHWRLVRMQNGKLAIIKYISVTLTDKEVETTEPINETVELFVYLEA